jgi:transcriptional antiterminator RfaH
MPILAEEPTLFPPTLLENPAATDAEWWVLYSLSRHEKQLCRRLHVDNLGYYCPTIEKRYRSPGGRARVSYLPLFPNYVFLWGDELARYQAVSTGYVSRCLQVTDPTQFLRELQQVQQLIGLGVPLTPEERLEPGMRVRVKAGPLKGTEGTVLERRGSRRLLVQVNFIQRGASMDLGDYELEELA